MSYSSLNAGVISRIFEKDCVNKTLEGESGLSPLKSVCTPTSKSSIVTMSLILYRFWDIQRQIIQWLREILVTDYSRSLKMAPFHRWHPYEILLASHHNYVPVSYHFRYKGDIGRKSRFFSYPTCIWRTLNGIVPVGEKKFENMFTHSNIRTWQTPDRQTDNVRLHRSRLCRHRAAKVTAVVEQLNTIAKDRGLIVYVVRHVCMFINRFVD